MKSQNFSDYMQEENVVPDKDVSYQSMRVIPKIILTIPSSIQYVCNYNDTVQIGVSFNYNNSILKALHTIDLHGCTKQEAAQICSNFIENCLRKNLDRARIITGKGLHSDHYPILKNLVLYWLQIHDAVLGFQTARPRYGGSGCFIVALKKYSYD